MEMMSREMAQAIDLVGKRFGSLVVLRMERHSNGNRAWVCQCDCGNITKPIVTGNLRNGNTTKCVDHPYRVDLTGQRFGKLTVISYHHTDKRIDENGKNHTKTYWLCECDCGNLKVYRSDMIQSKFKSCGCSWYESHGSIEGKVLHTTDWYNNYLCARSRVTNPNNPSFKRYDDLIQGIKFEPEWLENPFAFHEYIGDKPSPKHSIDRVNNSLGYIKGNVRWATVIEQANNKREVIDKKSIIEPVRTKLFNTYDGTDPHQFHNKNCIYSFWNDEGNCIYIGKSTNISYTIRRHLTLLSNIADEQIKTISLIKIQTFDTEEEIENAKYYFIDKYNPINNIQQKKKISDRTFEEKWKMYTPIEIFNMHNKSSVS